MGQKSIEGSNPSSSANPSLSASVRCRPYLYVTHCFYVDYCALPCPSPSVYVLTATPPEASRSGRGNGGLAACLRQRPRSGGARLRSNPRRLPDGNARDRPQASGVGACGQFDGTGPCRAIVYGARPRAGPRPARRAFPETALGTLLGDGGMPIERSSLVASRNAKPPRKGVLSYDFRAKPLSSRER